MKKGKVKFYNESKGYGFILDEGGKEIFVHASGLVNGQPIRQDDSVQFEESQGKKGINAVNVQKV